MQSSRLNRNTRTYLTMALVCVMTLLGIIFIMPSAAAQSGGRLRVVVRTPAGGGIAGLVVRVDREALDQSVAQAGFASATTDQRGVADFDTVSPNPWPVGGYLLRFRSGTSRRPVMSETAQGIANPLLAIQIRGSHDDWAMYVLDYQGNLQPDNSLSLFAPPQLHAPAFPTPAPLTINQALAARGLATMAPQFTLPTPGGPVTAAAPVPAEPPAAASGSSSGGDSPLLWLAVGITLGGIFLLHGRIGQMISTWLAQPPTSERPRRRKNAKQTGRRTPR
jgi:hypothetical protein